MELKLNKVRLAFPSLYEAKSFGDDNSAAAFSGSFILAKNDPQVATVNNMIAKVAKDKWKEKAEGMLKLIKSQDKTCLHDGDLKEQYEGFPGNFFIAARSQSRPLVLDKDKSPLTASDGKPYAGCYVNVILDVWPQDNKYGKRINATLKGVQFAGDGDAFSGSAPASADAFEDLSVDTGNLA